LHPTGISSYFTEYDSSGRAVFDGHLVAGTSSYRAFKQPWEGRPAGGPAIAVAAGQGTATVYASWNGTTEVEQWSVLGGADTQELSVLGVGRRAGFETAITVPDPPAYLAVEALDNTGAVVEVGRPPVARRGLIGTLSHWVVTWMYPSTPASTSARAKVSTPLQNRLANVQLPLGRTASNWRDRPAQ
jgi:hypothetical protein